MRGRWVSKRCVETREKKEEQERNLSFNEMGLSLFGSNLSPSTLH